MQFIKNWLHFAIKKTCYTTYINVQLSMCSPSGTEGGDGLYPGTAYRVSQIMSLRDRDGVIYGKC